MVQTIALCSALRGRKQLLAFQAINQRERLVELYNRTSLQQPCFASTCSFRGMRWCIGEMRQRRTGGRRQMFFPSPPFRIADRDQRAPVHVRKSNLPSQGRETVCHVKGCQGCKGSLLVIRAVRGRCQRIQGQCSRPQNTFQVEHSLSSAKSSFFQGIRLGARRPGTDYMIFWKHEEQKFLYKCATENNTRRGRQCLNAPLTRQTGLGQDDDMADRPREKCHRVFLSCFLFLPRNCVDTAASSALLSVMRPSRHDSTLTDM